MNDAAFENYALGYTEYAKTLKPTDDPELIQECDRTIDIIENEWVRRLNAEEDKQRIAREPSLKLLICGIICTICGLISIFFSWIGLIFIGVGLTMLFAELRK